MPQNVLVSALVTVGTGLVLLLLLWPTPDRAVKLLARWGVPDPDEAGRAEALRYLKRRRLVYPFVYVASGFALTGIMTSPGWSAILVSLLTGAVVAEVLAQRPRRGSVREAALTSPGVRDLLSPWTTGTWAVLAVAAIGVPAAALLGAPLPTMPPPGPVLPLVLAVGSTLAGILVVGLAVRRPPALLDRADEALRLRSARVGAGLAMAALGVSGLGWNTGAGAGLFLAGLVGWLATTARVRPVPATA